jgi:flagella basal body P-ring formation protein FlgA
LRADVAIAHARVTLADVVAPDAALDEFGAIDLGPAPRVGYVERYSRAQLEHALRQHGATGVAWQGASAVTLHTNSQSVPALRLRDAALRAAHLAFDTRYPSVDVAAVGVVADVQCPVGPLEIRVRPLTATTLAARVPVWIDLLVDGQIYRSVVVPLAFAWSRPVYLARRAMAAGERADLGDFELANADIAGKQALAVGSTPTSFRLRQSMKAGQLLAAAAVAADGAVQRGDHLRLRVRSGQIGIETDAVALADALPGQLLAVRPARGSDSVTGRLGAAGTVNIE